MVHTPPHVRTPGKKCAKIGIGVRTVEPKIIMKQQSVIQNKRKNIKDSFLFSLVIFISSQFISTILSFFWLKLFSNDDYGMGNGVILIIIYLFLTISIEILGIIFVKYKLRKFKYRFKILIFSLIILNLSIPLIWYFIFYFQFGQKIYKSNAIIVLEDSSQIEQQLDRYIISDCLAVDDFIPRLNNSVETTCTIEKISGYSHINIIALDKIQNSNNLVIYKIRIFELNGTDLKNLKVGETNLELVYQVEVPLNGNPFDKDNWLALTTRENPWDDSFITIFEQNEAILVGFFLRDSEGYSIKWKK